MKLLAAIALAAAALALTATASTAGAAPGGSHRIQGLVPHIPPTTHATFASRLSAASQTTKTPKLNCIATCSAYESTINRYFTDVAADNGLLTNVYSVATQYSGIKYDETFNASTNASVDTNPFPTSNTCQDGSDKYCVTDQQLQNEIGKMIAAHKWPTQTKTALYFIFTPANVGVCVYPGAVNDGNECTTNVFCAYHSNSNSNTFLYAVEPDAAAIPGPPEFPHPCDSGEAPAGNGADATINTVSHEQNEAITDPTGGGWIADDGAGGAPQDEMADLCAYDFGTPLGTPGTEYNQVINSDNYFLQLEYSNAADSNTGGCVPYLGGPVTPNNPAYGSGPLVAQNEPPVVMMTNTVYAIYWLPAAPVNTKLPTISGTAKVGRTLRAGNGAWSNLPKFTYRWLRCSSTGKSCRSISSAASARYVLKKADKGHRLEVRVTGTNMVGSVSATSAATATVKS